MSKIGRESVRKVGGPDKKIGSQTASGALLQWGLQYRVVQCQCVSHIISESTLQLLMLDSYELIGVSIL